MKYLNDDNLFFRMGDIQGLTPTNANQNYNITVYEAGLPNIINQYDGQIFFHSLDQKIAYDYLLRIMIENIDIENISYPHSQKIIPIVDVVFTVGSDSYSETVGLYYKPEGMSDSEMDVLIAPPDPNTTNFYPALMGCENPVVGFNQKYPAIVNIHEFVPTGETVQIDDDMSYEINDYTSLYLFEIADDVNIIATTDSLQDNDYPVKMTCDAPYTLMWYDVRGFFQSQAFYGTESDNFTHNSVTNLEGKETKYQTQERREWNIQSDWVQSPKTYWSLFMSPVIWLFDIEKQKYFRVLITSTNYQHKVNRKPFRFNVTLKLNKSNIYR